MDASHIALLTPAEVCQTLTTAQLDRAYESAMRQSERICEEERARTLRLQQLLLEHENDALQQQLAIVEAQLEVMEDREENTQGELGQLDADLQRAQSDLRTRSREVERYRAELSAMNNVTTDSTKLLTEKLALAREVATLKPEIEHLQSQVALNKNVLAEKLALQRELSTLQVELETERRAVQRTKINASKSAEPDIKLASQLEELRKELAKEKREAQKTERESRKQATEWESQKTILESKLDAFRNKLRSTKEQLKEAHQELKEAHQELEEAHAAAIVPKVELLPARATVGNARKRQTAHFDPDATLGTPRQNGLHPSKRAKTASLPGDKSTFSITPFLNKTMSILPDTPDTTEETEEPQQLVKAPHDSVGQASPTCPKQSKPRKATAALAKRKESRVLQEIQAAPKANGSSSKANKAVSKKPFGLAKVVEEDTGENEEAADSVSDLTTGRKAAVKKKQKILGHRKSLFDDDDLEETKSRARAVGLLGATRGLGLRGGSNLGPMSLGIKGKTLTEFSPLKKERKAPSTVSSVS